MDRGAGVYLWDTSGKQYLDFIQGWAVNSLGHSPKLIADTLFKQASTLLNCSPAYFNTPQLQFSHDLVSSSCFDRVFLMSSGAEANESAIKLARKYGKVKKQGAFKIITTLSSFHGRTLATMSATGKTQWKEMYAPMPGGFVHVPFNDIEAMKSAIDGDTCAVMLELIQGEGGVNQADLTYIQTLKAYCEEQNVLFIADEVQTGFGRTGTLFCYEQYGIEPDIMTLGKGIGGGFPMSAMLCKEALNIFEAGEQGGTYTGQPLAAAVGRAVLTEINTQSFLDNVIRQGQFLRTQLDALSTTYPISKVRGNGLLIAFDTSISATDLATLCFESGLLINASGPHTIRLIPALIVDKEHCEEMLSILTQCLIRLTTDGK